MRAASKYGLRFVVLDRPNPINGVTVSGLFWMQVENRCGLPAPFSSTRNDHRRAS